ncbi:MAG: ABC transporter ATP-binding protein [bacterium]|nr:ABC transporter ATP-binding protein [bacterium]
MEEKKEGSPLLEIRHLSVCFTQYESLWRQRTVYAVRDLSLSLHAGEVVAVVGSSGSGKSLLAHAVMGILPYNAHEEGEILYQGERLTEKKLRKLRGNELVLVPQSVSYLDPLMQVGEQIRKGKRDEESKKRSLEILARYGLAAETENRYPFELSGGMIRRILISSAVMEKPKLVIADEPTPGLHMRAAKRVMGHFRELADEGAAVLLITHDLELALTAADRIVVLYAGMELEEAKASDFREESHLRHPYSKALFRAMPRNGFQVTAGNQPYGRAAESACPYAARCEYCQESCSQQKIETRTLRGGRVRCLLAE